MKGQNYAANLHGSLTTSSYVTKSNWSKTALCFAKYLSLYCFFLRPKIEQFTASKQIYTGISITSLMVNKMYAILGSLKLNNEVWRTHYKQAW
jgi:hypothetical protein